MTIIYFTVCLIMMVNYHSFAPSDFNLIKTANLKTMALVLTTEELARERDFLKEFTEMCTRYGYFDRVKVMTELLGLNVHLQLNVKDGRFVNSKISFKNGTENYRIVAKGSLVERKVFDDKGVEMEKDGYEKMNLELQILQYNEALTLDNRRDKLKEYKKQPNFIKELANADF